MSSLHYKQCPMFDDALGVCQCDLIAEVKEETELKIMSKEGSLEWMATAIIKGAREPLIEMIEDLVYQSCYVPPEGQADPYLDSMALSVYANAMRFLAEEGKIKITSQYGRRVIGEKIKDE